MLYELSVLKFIDQFYIQIRVYADSGYLNLQFLITILKTTLREN